MTFVPITRTTLYYAWMGYRLPRKPIISASCDLPNRLFVDDPFTGRRASIAYLRGDRVPITPLIDETNAPEIVRRYIEKAFVIKYEASQLHHALGRCSAEEVAFIFPTYVPVHEIGLNDAPVMPFDLVLDRLRILALVGVTLKLIEKGQRWNVLD